MARPPRDGSRCSLDVSLLRGRPRRRMGSFGLKATLLFLADHHKMHGGVTAKPCWHDGGARGGVGVDIGDGVGAAVTLCACGACPARISQFTLY